MQVHLTPISYISCFLLITTPPTQVGRTYMEGEEENRKALCDKVFTVEGKMKRNSKPGLLYNMWELFCTLCGSGLLSRVKNPAHCVLFALSYSFLLSSSQIQCGPCKDSYTGAEPHRAASEASRHYCHPACFPWELFRSEPYIFT